MYVLILLLKISFHSFKISARELKWSNLLLSPQESHSINYLLHHAHTPGGALCLDSYLIFLNLSFGNLLGHHKPLSDRLTPSLSTEP